MSNLASSSDFGSSFKPSNEKFEFSSDLNLSSSSSPFDNIEKPSSIASESSLDNLSTNASQAPANFTPLESAQSVDAQAPFTSAQPLGLSSQPQASFNNEAEANISSMSHSAPEAANTANSADGDQQFSQEDINAAVDIAAEALYTNQLDRDATVSLLMEQGYSEALANYVVDSVCEYASESGPSEEPRLSEQDKQIALNIAADAIINKLRDRETTVSMLMERGYSEAVANQAVDAIYARITQPQNYEANNDNSGMSGTGLIIMGIIFLLTGILLTALSVGNAIWYGAIVVGIVEICRGIAKGSN